MLTIPHPRTGGPAEVATTWGELSLDQAQYLLANPDASVDTFGILGSLFTPRATRLEVQQLDAVHTEQLLEALEFLTTPCPSFTECPRSVTVADLEGRRVLLTIPEQLATHSFGQACDLGTSIEALADDVPALRVRSLAIYLLPQLFGTKELVDPTRPDLGYRVTKPALYDTELLEPAELLVGALKMAEAIPIADFFLPISKPLYEATASDYTTASSRPRSTEQGSPSLASAGTTTRLPTRWQAVINYFSTRFTASRGQR